MLSCVTYSPSSDKLDAVDERSSGQTEFALPSQPTSARATHKCMLSTEKLCAGDHSIATEAEILLRENVFVHFVQVRCCHIEVEVLGDSVMCWGWQLVARAGDTRTKRAFKRTTSRCCRTRASDSRSSCCAATASYLRSARFARSARSVSRSGHTRRHMTTNHQVSWIRLSADFNLATGATD